MQENKYKWDLTLVYKDKSEFFSDLEHSKDILRELELYKGQLGNIEKIVEYLKKKTIVSKVLERANLFAFLQKSQNNSDAEALKMFNQVKSLNVEFAERLAFEEPELTALPVEILDSFEKDKRLSDYDRSFFHLKRNKKHILSEKEEKLLSGISKFTDFDSLFEALDNVEIKFEPVLMPDNTMVELTNVTYSSLMKHNDRTVRKQAFENLHSGFSKFNLTLSQNYINEVQCSSFFAKSSNFDSTLDSKLFYEEVNKEIYEALIRSVNKNLPLLHDYIYAKQNILGLSDFYIYDIYANAISDIEISNSYDEAYSMVKESLKNLGEDYQNLLEKAKSQGWIDVFPSSGKDNGAFSVSSGTGNPFVLLNYQSTYGEILTIAHEMGHAMHSFYSENNQPYPKQDYVIFVAEVASTVNELMFSRYMIKNAESQKLKNYIIDSLLSNIYATIFRQTMFSEFEYNIHKMANNDEPLAYDILNQNYLDLLHKYFGPRVTIPKFAEFEWSRIPHFYRPFYVYKYATGLICAIAISEKLFENKDNYAEKYKSFLKSGCSSDPVSLLKLAEVDISKQETFDNAFNFYKELISQYKKI